MVSTRQQSEVSKSSEGIATSACLSSMIPEARSHSEDWTGLRSRAERRRIQTRLNVRAYRKRKAAVAAAAVARDESTCFDDIGVSVISASDHPRVEIWATIPGNDDGETILFIPPLVTADCRRVAARYISTLSLSLDHLIPLIEYNIFRAVMTNIHITGLQRLLDKPCRYETSTPWSTIPVFPSPWLSDADGGDEAPLPPSLRPTSLQKHTQHPPWIDILPCGRLRDNAIGALRRGGFNLQELCADLLPGLGGHGEMRGTAGRESLDCSEGDTAAAGMVVWTNPWENRGWEVKPMFLKKWAWLLEGCSELMAATNQYRRLRGEDDLSW